MYNSNVECGPYGMRRKPIICLTEEARFAKVYEIFHEMRPTGPSYLQKFVKLPYFEVEKNV